MGYAIATSEVTGSSGRLVGYNVVVCEIEGWKSSCCGVEGCSKPDLDCPRFREFGETLDVAIQKATDWIKRQPTE
jgi:hypothetical protein